MEKLKKAFWALLLVCAGGAVVGTYLLTQRPILFRKDVPFEVIREVQVPATVVVTNTVQVTVEHTVEVPVTVTPMPTPTPCTGASDFGSAFPCGVSQWSPHITQVSTDTGIDPVLLAGMVWAASGGDPAFHENGVDGIPDTPDDEYGLLALRWDMVQQLGVDAPMLSAVELQDPVTNLSIGAQLFVALQAILRQEAERPAGDASGLLAGVPTLEPFQRNTKAELFKLLVVWRALPEVLKDPQPDRGTEYACKALFPPPPPEEESWFWGLLP